MNPIVIDNPEVLHWHRVTLRLTPTRHIGNGTPALIILNAFFKSIKPQIKSEHRVKQAFRALDVYAHRMKMHAGEPVTIEVELFGADDLWINYWLAALQQHVTANLQAGFVISAPPVVTDIHFDFRQSIDADFHAELEFLSPLPFKRDTGSSRTQITKEVFFNQLMRRTEQLFGNKFTLPDISDTHLQCNHWNYTELHHASKSQPGNTQYYNGCFGSLYFTGDLKPILPWLKLAASIHAGGSVELNPLGYCRLHRLPRPLLDKQLASHSQWNAALIKVLDGHDDGEQINVENAVVLSTESYCNDLMCKVKNSEWQPAPAEIIRVDHGNGIRLFEKIPFAEEVMHTLLHELLSEPIERKLKASVTGFRRSHSVQAAVTRVKELLEQGYRYIVQFELEDIFPGIPLERIDVLLDDVIPPGDTQTRQLLNKLLRAPYLDGGCLKPHQCGMAQGGPLTPLLAKLYLGSLDGALNQPDAQLVTYANDFIILARTHKSARELLHLVRGEAEEGHLELSEEQPVIRSIEEGFRFLGQPFGGEAENTVAHMLLPPAKKSIYITEHGCTLGHSGDTLEIRLGGKLAEAIPLHRVADISILASTSLSSRLMQKCAKLGVTLSIATGDGCHITSLLSKSRKHHDIAAAQAMHYARLTDNERLELAKGFARSKIANYKPLVNARYSKGSVNILDKLDQFMAGIETAQDTSQVRGYEGAAARLMFATLDSFIRVPEFNFDKRCRDNPDRMNVLFNFGYHLLFSRLNTMVRAAGLNPYMGFLHEGTEDYETLVCDIQELFRAPLDRHLIALVNLKIIKPDDFSEKENGLRLAPRAIRRFIEHFERWLHGDAGGITQLEAMQAQVRAFVRYVTEDQALWYFNYHPAINPKSGSRPVKVAHETEVVDAAPYDMDVMNFETDPL